MPVVEDTLGRSVYGALGRAVRNGVNSNNGEYCAIYVPSLAWILEQGEVNFQKFLMPTT